MATVSRSVAVNGTTLAWRGYGLDKPAVPPLLLLQRFRATMDDWDPLLLDLLAGERPVVAFDNRGVGESVGTTPATLEQAADDTAALIRALGYEQVDVLGWSMGGMIAAITAMRHPTVIRRVVLAGTCPPGNPASVPPPPPWMAVTGKPAYEDKDFLFIFFAKTAGSRKAGRESLIRMNRPGMAGSSVKSSAAVMRAQISAISGYWRDAGDWFNRLASIEHPTLVTCGDCDGAFPVSDGVILAREIPNSRLIVYPGAGHGFLFQVPQTFAADVLEFLRA